MLFLCMHSSIHENTVQSFVGDVWKAEGKYSSYLKKKFGSTNFGDSLFYKIWYKTYIP